MRVRLGILLVLLAAACGGLAWTHASVNAQKDQVDVQVTTVAGDVSAVEGTEVTLDASLFGRLFWSIRCTPGAEPMVQSKYTHYWNEQPQHWSWDSSGLYVSFSPSNWYEEDSEEEPDRHTLTTLLRAVSERCPAGTEDYWETVRLRDYYEEFPIFVGYISQTIRSNYVYLDGNESLEMMAQDALRQVFHIPVPEDLMVEVHMEKDLDGDVLTTDVNAEWDLDAAAVSTEQGIYFTLESSDPAVTLDFSQSAVEQGLYFLSIHQEPYTGESYGGMKEAVVVSMDGTEIRTVCPSPGAKSSWLGTSEDGTWIYYAAQTGEETTLWVLDAQSGAVVSQTALPFGPADFPDGAYLSGAFVDEGLVMPYRWDNQFVLVTVSKTGEASVALSGDLTKVWEVTNLEDPNLIYDGRRLVIAAFQRYDYSFCMAAYTNEELSYLGCYDVGLDLLSSEVNRLWQTEEKENSLRVRFLS